MSLSFVESPADFFVFFFLHFGRIYFRFKYYQNA